MGVLNRLGNAVRDRVGARTDLAEPAGTFVCGIDLGGRGGTVLGQAWLGFDEALDSGLLQAPGVSRLGAHVDLSPYAEPGLRAMLTSVVFRARTLELRLSLPPARYALYLWIAENHQSHWHSLALSVDGQPVARGLGDLERGVWQRLGPWPSQAPGGQATLLLDSGSDTVDAHLMGLSAYRLD